MQFVPFAAMTGLRKYEIALIPSLSCLRAIRSGTVRKKDGRRSVVVFADPVYSARDARVARRGERVRSERPIFKRLAFSDDEAKYIVAEMSDALVLRGFDASRSRLMSLPLTEFEVIHFATHAVVNRKVPQLSGLVLSLVDRRGDGVPGLLTLEDIYQLKVRRGSLVVLSGCDTGWKSASVGEGISGLTRGFLYAGARGVIASLWAIDDAAAAQLMREFYSELRKSSKSPAAALRDAQRRLASIGRWSSPYYWAGFVYEGDWR